MERDIFDDMIKRVDCSYVSDLRYNKKIVESKLKTMDLRLYNEKQLEEFAQYVFNITWLLSEMVYKVYKSSRSQPARLFTERRQQECHTSFSI